ncbi:hypothetical protein J6P92_01890 [bacterium]|nr:hypothetical protein [bacterium]
MVKPINYIPAIVRWEEDGKTQERILNIEEGIRVKFEQSGNLEIEPKPYEGNRNTPVYTLAKEDAYSILGLSKADKTGYMVPNGFKNKAGKEIFVLDHRDIEVAKSAEKNDFINWIDDEGHFVEAGSITSDNVNQNDILKIIHNGINKNGETEQYEILVFYNTKNVTLIPIIVQWLDNENSKVEQRKVKIEEGLTIKLEQSKKTYTAQAFSGEIPVWDMYEEDAYNVLGISHANEDGYTKDGQYTYVLDSEDIDLAKKASGNKLSLWIGSVGQFVKAEEIKNSKDSLQNGGLKILHKGINGEGEKGTFEVLIFIPAK